MLARSAAAWLAQDMFTASSHVGSIDTRCRESRQAPKTLANAPARGSRPRPRRSDVATRDTRNPTPHFEIASLLKLFRFPRVGIVLAIPHGVHGEAAVPGNRWVMMRNTIKRKGKRVIVFVGCLCALLGGVGLNPIDSATTPAPTWQQAQAAIHAEFDYETILDVVRRHRPTAADGWRQTLASAIFEEARAESIDPLLVTAIIARESSFKSRVVSHAGAVGLMQLRPWVAKDVALRTDVAWNGRQTLHAPELNVRLGVRYYKELVERFGDPQVALTAYCFGPTRVSKQLRAGTFDGSRYAREILDFYEQLNDSGV
jgi:hypothetical protein